MSERAPIVREDRVRPLRSPQAARQRRIAAAAVLAMAGIVAGGRLLLVPRERVYRLGDFETAVVRQGDLAQTVQASGTVTVPVTLSVLAPETGYAALLEVQEGDTVSRGQRLVRLEVPDLEDEREDLEADLAVKEQNLASSIEQNRFALRRLEQGLGFLEQDIRKAEAERARIEQRVAINASRRSELEEAEEALDGLLRRREEKRLDIEEQKTLAALSRSSQQAAIDQVRIAVQRHHQRIAAASVASPMDGEVLEVEDSLAVPGSLINQNQVLFSLADRASALVELEVSETCSAALRPGQAAALTVGGRQIQGTILSIGKLAQASSDGIGSTVTVKVKPEAAGQSLLPGATVVGELQVGELRGALYLPRGPYLTTGGQRALYVVEGDTARRREAVFGAVQGADIVVLRGAQAGEEVITSGYQNFIEYETVRLVTEKKKERAP